MGDISVIDMVDGELAGINARYLEELIPVQRINPVSELQMRLTAMQMDANAKHQDFLEAHIARQTIAFESIAVSLRGSLK